MTKEYRTAFEVDPETVADSLIDLGCAIKDKDARLKELETNHKVAVEDLSVGTLSVAFTFTDESLIEDVIQYDTEDN